MSFIGLAWQQCLSVVGKVRATANNATDNSQQIKCREFVCRGLIGHNQPLWWLKREVRHKSPPYVPAN